MNRVTKHGSVIVSDEIRNNIKELVKCDIVWALFKDLLDMNIDIEAEYTSNLHVFMMNVNKEYHARGGNSNKTIGSVSDALYSLNSDYLAARSSK